MTEPSPEDRQATHLAGLIRAFQHTHSSECLCPNPTACTECDHDDPDGACAGRCEHAKTYQSLRTTPAGGSA